MMIAGPYYDVECDDCGSKIRIQAVRMCTKKGWEVTRNNRKQTLHVRCPECVEKLGLWGNEDGVHQD